MRNVPWKWIGLAAGAAGLIIAARALPVGEWLTGFNEWVAGLGKAGMLVFVLVYVAATVLFLPGWVMTVGAGFAFGLVWGTVAVSAGSTIGAAVAFLVARYIAREKVADAASRSPKFKAIDRAIGREGWKIVALLRLSPLVPFNLSNYLYGLTAIKFWPYVLASWLAMLPGTVLYVYLGVVGKTGLQVASGRTAERSPLEYGFLALGLAATVAVTIFVTRVARNALRTTEVADE